MGLIGYGLRGLIRNRGRTFGIAIGVIIAICLISGTNIATDSMTSYEVQNGLNDVVIDLWISSEVDDQNGIMGILQDVQADYSAIEKIFPLTTCGIYSNLVLNATGSIYWPDINASWFAPRYFEDHGIMAGFDYPDLDHPRLQGLINITEGSFPNNNASILIDETTAARYNLSAGANLSIGIRSYEGEYPIYNNYTRGITNLTIAGLFNILDLNRFATLLYSDLSYGDPIILANSTTMRGLFDLLIPNIEGISPYPNTFYNIIIDHAIVDVYNLESSKAMLTEISNKIYSKGGLSYDFYTNDVLYYRILSTEYYIRSLRNLLFLVSIPALLIGLYLTSTLYNQTLERRIVEIGQLKSKGASTRQIASWFLLESGIIGLIGGAIGYLGGYAISPLFLMTTLGEKYAQFLSMNLIHGSVTSLLFSLALGAGACVISVIKPVRRLNKMVVVDATKEFINFRSNQPWKSKFDVPALVLGIIPITWVFIFNDAIIPLLPSDIRPFFIFISQAMSAVAVIAPFFLAYGVIKLVAGRSPPRFAKIARGVASIVTRKSAWLIGRNVGGRPKQSGGLVFILALTICLGIVTSSTKASQEVYENYLAYGQVGADIHIELAQPSSGNYSFAMKDILREFSPDVALVTPAIKVFTWARGTPGAGNMFDTLGYVIGLNATEYCEVVGFKPDFISGGDPTLTFSTLAQKPNGTLILESWAKLNGYKVGDPIFLEFTQGYSFAHLSFEIVGFFSALPGFWEGNYLTIAANLDYLNNTLPGLGSVYSDAFVLAKMVDHPTVNGTTLAQNISENFYQNVSSVKSFEETLANLGESGYTSVVKILDVEYAFIVIIATAGLAIIISRSFSERRREIATLRARGMEFRDLLKLQGGEGTTLVILGSCLGTVGLLMAYFLNYQLGLGFQSFATLPRPFVLPLSLLWQFIITFTVLVIVAWIISWREVKRTEIPEIADILRVY